MPSSWKWILLLLLGGVIAFAPLPSRAGSPIERHIRIEASQFSYSPGEVHVNEGDRVTIELASTDVVHGLFLDGYDTSITADPGQPQRLTFTAGIPGSFRFRCNVTCGTMHPFMIGRLVVGNNDRLLRVVALTLLASASVIFLPRKSINP